MKKMERGFWSSGKGFVIAAAGSAIGRYVVPPAIFVIIITGLLR